MQHKVEEMKYSIRPQEHELRQARQTVESTVERARHRLELEQLTVNLGASSTPDSELYGAHGAAVGSGVLQLYFNPSAEDWQESLEELTFKTYGKAWFDENSELENLNWVELLSEAFSVAFASEFNDRRTEVSEELAEEWSRIDQSLQEEFSGDLDVSWQLKWLLGEEIKERHGLERFTELELEDLREAGESLFR